MCTAQKKDRCRFVIQKVGRVEVIAVVPSSSQAAIRLDLGYACFNKRRQWLESRFSALEI